MKSGDMDCHVAGAPRNDGTGAGAPRNDGVGLVIASEARQSMCGIGPDSGGSQ